MCRTKKRKKEILLALSPLVVHWCADEKNTSKARDKELSNWVYVYKVFNLFQTSSRKKCTHCKRQDMNPPSQKKLTVDSVYNVNAGDLGIDSLYLSFGVSVITSISQNICVQSMKCYRELNCLSYDLIFSVVCKTWNFPIFSVSVWLAIWCILRISDFQFIGSFLHLYMCKCSREKPSNEENSCLAWLPVLRVEW